MGLGVQHNMIVFTKKYGSDMIQALNNTPIFFPLMLSQACLESGYGTSKAAKIKNNFFGVMSGNTTATFSSPMQAFSKQISLFMNPNLPYESHGVLSAKTPYEQARAIADSGYYSMNNDDTLPANLASKKGSYTEKQSADYYYKHLKSFIDDALTVFPFGKISTTNANSVASAITNTQIPTV
jgi:flagellum-specific peptidoglycan hydrolase FlgJ